MTSSIQFSEIKEKSSLKSVDLTVSPEEKRPQLTIRGRVVHADPDSTPAHHQVVRLSEKKIWGGGEYATGRTNAKGKFKFTINNTKNLDTFVVRVITYPWEEKEDLIESWRERVLFKKEQKVENGKSECSFGDIPIEFFEYQHNWPRYKWPKQSYLQPSESTLGYQIAFTKSLVPIGEAKLIPTTRSSPALHTIANLFSPNFTMNIEKDFPGATKTAAFMVRELFRGFNPIQWKKGASPQEVYGEFNFDELEMDGENYLPNTKIYLLLKGNQDPEIQRIDLQWRKMTEPKAIQPPVRTPNAYHESMLDSITTYLPQDKDFEWALSAFRTAWNVAGQNRAHLGESHLYPEQIIVAARRNLITHPLLSLFCTFARGLLTINHKGEFAIFGPTGLITVTSALTTDSVEQDLRNYLGSVDYTFEPRKPLFEGDIAAKINRIWWDILSEFVDLYFENNKIAMESKENWLEIRKFSDDLVNHSYPYRLRDNESDYGKFLDPTEIARPDIDRKEVEGFVRVMPPITEVDVPNEIDLAKLKKLVVHFIYCTTIHHTLNHDIGAEECSDPHWGSMSGGDVNPDPLLKKTLPSSNNAMSTLAFLKTLAGVDYGYILKNEYGDIPKELIGIIEKRRDELTALGLPPEKVRSTVNI